MFETGSKTLSCFYKCCSVVVCCFQPVWRAFLDAEEKDYDCRTWKFAHWARNCHRRSRSYRCQCEFFANHCRIKFIAKSSATNTNFFRNPLPNRIHRKNFTNDANVPKAAASRILTQNLTQNIFNFILLEEKTKTNASRRAAADAPEHTQYVFFLKPLVSLLIEFPFFLTVCSVLVQLASFSNDSVISYRN